ncbi:MAG TPA: hypothetical protein PKH79_02215 [Prolixibacteraceae bacterium]|nr:hypothetical protein [Prolixibacteraceae bacterium]
MMNFLSKIFGDTILSPPDAVKNSLKERFPSVINVEWNKNGDNFEAIFYKDSIECIANFDRSGTLIEYKMFLSEDFLPQNIKTTMVGKGEIMNAVMSNKGNSITYEIIYRDKELIRYVMIFNEIGVVLEEKVL